MGSIATTTFVDPLRYPSQQFIDRENYDGQLWFLRRTGQTTFDIYRSSDNGQTWAAVAGTSVTRANLQEVSGLFMDSSGHIHITYRVYESGADKIFYRRLPADSGAWSAESQVASASAAAAGNVYTGMDLVAFKLGTTFYVHMAVGTQDGVNGGVTIFSATVSSTGTYTNRNNLISGTRSWLNGPPGIVHPSIDFVHIGDRKTTTGTPNLWLAWGRSTTYSALFTYNSGPSWTSPNWNTPSVVSGLAPNQPSNTAVYDAHSDQMLFAYPNGTAVRVAARSVDNSTQTTVDSPAHPQGVIRHTAISVSSATSNIRVFAVGTSNGQLYYVDYDKANNSWSASWTAVSASAIIGTDSNNYSVRRVNFGNGHNDVVVATGAGPAYNLISTSSTAASSPKTPVITSPANVTTKDVASPLTLVWTFQDDDPSDFQDSYALRRAIGAGSFEYYNATAGTWGGSEVFNLSGTTSVTLPASWGADSDANHFYSVKVRDQQGNSSANATNVTIVPSSKDNPTITSPTASPNTALVTASWTVATQTAYRIVLAITSTGAVVRDTGWVTSTATSVTLPDVLLAQSYTMYLTTRNDEGLESNTVTQVFTPAFTPPQVATPLLTPLSSIGVIRSTITNPDPVGAEATNLSNAVYRRKVGETGPGVRVATIIPSTPVNLVAPYRKSFEETDSSASWGTANGSISTAARDTTQFRSGIASYAQTAVNGTGFAGINFGPLNTFPAVPGDQFFLSFWFKANAGIQVRGQVGYRNAANASNGSPSQGALVVATGSWQQFTMTSTAAPANTAFAFPNLGSSPTANVAGDKIYVDDVVYYKTGSVATPVSYDDFTAASDTQYEYSIVTTAINGSVSQSAWVS